MALYIIGMSYSIHFALLAGMCEAQKMEHINTYLGMYRAKRTTGTKDLAARYTDCETDD